MIKVYFMRSSFSENKEKEYLASLSDFRKQKALSLKNEEKRRASVAASHILECALSEMGIAEHDVVYETGRNGKPHLKNYPDIHFSLSHTNGAAICAVSDRPVGCDIEKIRPYNTGIAKKYFPDLSLVSERIFFTRWTECESLAKLHGTGIIQSLKEGPAGFSRHYEENGFIICVSSEERIQEDLLYIVKDS